MNAYRNCRFCRGRGCLACPGEADKAYKKAFPDGAKPLVTIATDDVEGMAALGKILSEAGWASAKTEATERLTAEIDACGVEKLVGPIDADALSYIASERAAEILAERIAQLGAERKKSVGDPTKQKIDPATITYAVGDRVRMLETIVEPPSDELPAQHFCDEGEILIVRKIGGFWPVYVSHEHITDRSFGVWPDQIEKA